MGGRMYLGNQLVTPVIIDYKCSFNEITGNPTDNEALAAALNEKQNVIDDLETIVDNASAGKQASDTISNYGNIVTHNVSEFATASQGSKADTALQPSALSGYATENWVVGQGYLTGITSSMVTTALGYTPYNSTNPNGYQANVLEGVQVNGTDLTIVNKKVNVTVPTQASDIGAQQTLVSGTNIKTINNNSILGSGNISISGSSGDDWGQSLQGDIEIDNTFICASYKCYGNQKITSFSAPNATEASMNSCFRGCESLQTASLQSLSEVGYEAFSRAFQGCISLTSVSFPSLTNIRGYGFLYCFANCTSLQSSSLTALTNIEAGCFSGCFTGCTNLKDVYFPALTTTSFGSYVNQFDNMFNSVSGSTSGAITMHFPSNLESTIQGLSGYPNFGATAGILTLAFDLPATS